MTIAQALVAALADEPDTLEELRQLLRVEHDPERRVKAKEAADHLGVHPKTLTKYALQGRVRGAKKAGDRDWSFVLSELEILPADPPNIGEARARTRRRRGGPSSATTAIRGAA